MRILVVGPTGRAGSHVIDALRARDPDLSIRGFCRYPETRSRSIEVIPGNGDTGGRRASAIEVIPGNGDTGGRRASAIEVIPGNGDTGGRRASAIGVIPGNGDTGGRRASAIGVIPANGDTGGRRASAIGVIPGNGDTGGRRERPMEVVPELRMTSQQSDLIDCLCGDLENPADRALAVEGIDTVIHYAPAFHPREAAMGTGMIDAAVGAGVQRFIYVSALHAQASSVPGHAAKLEVEGYLAESGLEWTIVRPQSFMQNIDVAAALEAGALDLPFPLGTRQGHVDLADLGEVLAKVTTEDGHALASYDIASDEALSTAEIAALIATVSGKPVASGEMPAAHLVAGLETAGPAHAYVVDAISRLNAWQVRTGGRGNANTLRWLLGREPARFEDYVRRSLPAG
ncbi:NmrA family NAD(P)-binding protein [Novosphingobium sp. AP12]|uniref:NmrA family NAD(P)-binding protein n=1 Tax=Novosphingobium sp. AP12 TaxID=1144305 RepID=UPI000271ECD3|nr:NmrA family NAD(P)-binding protein [Novosphingobium sp. AP12]EJL24443.1 putative nucleoside-diphosphate sugar epimerase [Novosphingobium sp. AP12]